MQFKSTLLALTLGLMSCSQAEKIQVLSSLPDTDSLLVEKEILFGKDLKKGSEIIRISAADTCQTVQGVGAALTHASAWVFHNNLTPAKRDSLFKELFTPQELVSTTPVWLWEPPISRLIFSAIAKPKILHFPIFQLLKIIKM
jgi:hypothetical protein